MSAPDAYPRLIDDDVGGDPPCWAHLFEGADSVTSDLGLAELVREMADAVIIADATGTIVFWNHAAESLFGWSAAEATGRSLDLIVPERLRERHWTGYRRVMATGHTDYGGRLLEVPASHRDGRSLSIGFTVTLLRRPDGSVRGIGAVVRDETERWQERRALRAELARLRERTD
ncbi:MAG TPA: PAS domain S-box protein [Acidimicrobiales bacterium]|jgi:PAS domain S-box-containing protein